MVTNAFDIDASVRKIANFPKPGVLFYDITSILVNPEAFSYCVEQAVERYRHSEANAVVGIDARGFIFAAVVAYQLGLPLVLVRKNGKLPGSTYSRSFALEYGEDTIEVHKSDVKADMRFLIVDDLIATGGTLKATAEMLLEAGASVVGIFGVIGLVFLKYRELLSGYRVETLIDYDSE